MFGLLGGLIGAGIGRAVAARPMFRATPLAGLVAGKVVQNAISPRRAAPSSSGGGAPPGSPRPETPQQAPPTPAAQGQEAEQTQQVQQPQQPKPMVQQATENVREVAQQQQKAMQQPAPAPAPQKPVTADLLDENTPSAPPQQRLGGDAIPKPPVVANQTESASPVAKPADEQFPNVPQLALSGLTDKIGEPPPRRTFAMEDPNPSKPADTRSQAKHTGNAPAYEYQTLGSNTALTPAYSYRR